MSPALVRRAVRPCQNARMTAQIIDGKAIAAAFRREVRELSDRMAAQGKRRPGLAVVLVGDDPASHVYVRNKRLACEECGFVSVSHDLPHSATQTELLSLIERLNSRRRDRRHPGAGAAAGPHRRARRHRSDLARQGRGRLPPLQRRAARAAQSADAAVHALWRDPDARLRAAFPPRGSTRWSSAPRTSSVGRWRSSCCSPARRSPSATASPRTCARTSSEPTCWSSPSASPA